jgi:PAP2 superfamily C-terminal
MLQNIKAFVRENMHRQALSWKDKRFLIYVGLQLLFSAFSLYMTYLALDYTDGYQGYVVPDIILDHIPVFDVGYIFFQGSFVFIASVAIILLAIPESIPFALGSTSLFFAIRAVFMSLTHLSAPVVAHYSYFEYEHHVKQIVFTLSSGNDMFFSGHAGFPFLLALVFWKRKYIRSYFLLCSIIAAVAVLLGHLHYSIDVFSAFFISFGIYHFSKTIFSKEFSLIDVKTEHR